MIEIYVQINIHDLFDYERMYLTFNYICVILITKYPIAITMKEIRSITCCTILYKIILKILTIRLSNVINSVVDESRLEFIPDKVIHDNIIIAHEFLIECNRKHIYPICSVHMYLQKAYNIVECTILEGIKREMNFPTRFIKWIMVCISTVYYRYAINGQHSECLKEKGY